MQNDTRRAQRFWDRLAPLWDFYLLISGLKEKYREEAIDKLDLNQGDTVLDLACGTGLNFKHLREKVGDKGRIIGLDYSSKMLEEAKKRIKDNKWDNVMLVQKTAEKFEFKEKFDAVLCTWAMVSIPHYKKALRNSIAALKEGGRFVVLDFKENLGCFGKILNPIHRMVFNVTHQNLARKPWEEMRKHLKNVKVMEFPFGSIIGTVYIASGIKLGGIERNLTQHLIRETRNENSPGINIS